jgi:hypothetical protein
MLPRVYEYIPGKENRVILQGVALPIIIVDTVGTEKK